MFNRLHSCSLSHSDISGAETELAWPRRLTEHSGIGVVTLEDVTFPLKRCTFSHLKTVENIIKGKVK